MSESESARERAERIRKLEEELRWLSKEAADLRCQLQARADVNARMSQAVLEMGAELEQLRPKIKWMANAHQRIADLERQVSERDTHHRARVAEFESAAQAHKERAERLDDRCEELERQLAESQHECDSRGARIEDLERRLEGRSPLEPKYDLSIPSYGEVFTVAEFADMVRDELLRDCDGHGRLAKDGTMDGVVANLVFPSEVGRIHPSATHVVWFNK